MKPTTNPFRRLMYKMLMKCMAAALLMVLCKPVLADTDAYDSIGIEEVGDEIYILHKVEMSETLYSVSRRYNVSIYKIIKSNPPTEFGLEVGQIIKIPYVATTKANRPNQNKTNAPTLIKKSEMAEDITHTVAMKETLYSISKQYDATVEEIKQWNNLESNSIDVGQQLVIKRETAHASNDDTRAADNSKGHMIHIVEQSETLYSLSKRYDVTVASIMTWNNLTSPEIGIGQELIVGKTDSKENPNTLTVETSSVVKSDSIEHKAAGIEIDSAVFSVPTKSNDERMQNPITSSTDFEEIVESGVASLIEGTEGTRKYLALHRTAKVGTIMRVHNEMNDQEVFVRVLGKLPDTGINKNVVIRISKSAYDQLGAIDPRFRVTISYIP